MLVITCSVLLSVLIWPWSSFWAVTAFFAFAFAYSAVLAGQCAVLRHINGADPAPLASRVQLVRAWWRETTVAARVFYWWQPFCINRFSEKNPSGVATHSSRGVVLVHGFVCNRGVWASWLPALEARAIPYRAVDLEPLFVSIDDYVPILDAAVQQLELETGLAPMIVCHSMGGLAVRAWLRASGADQRAYRIVTIGTPHHGTVIGGRLPRLSWLINAEQMRYSSPWLTALTSMEEVARRRKFVCFYSNCDNIVAPTSTAMLPDADNRFVDGVPHLALLLEPRVVRETLALLEVAS